MVRSNRGKVVATLQYPIRVEVRRPKLERSASLAYFDAAKLTRAARAEFEVGYFESGCCRQAVLAVVRRGMVTALRVEACTQHKPIRLTPELQTMLSNARRQIGRHRDRPFRPMSVAQFMGKGGVAETIIEEGCYEFCITVWGYEVCVVCCKSVGPWWCAPVVRTVLE
jgi:hypothetical protein